MNPISAFVVPFLKSRRLLGIGFVLKKVRLVLKLCKNLHWSLDSRFSTQKNQTVVHKNYLNVSKGK